MAKPTAQIIARKQNFEKKIPQRSKTAGNETATAAAAPATATTMVQILYSHIRSYNVAAKFCVVCTVRLLACLLVWLCFTRSQWMPLQNYRQKDRLLFVRARIHTHTQWKKWNIMKWRKVSKKKRKKKSRFVATAVTAVAIQFSHSSHHSFIHFTHFDTLFICLHVQFI